MNIWAITEDAFKRRRPVGAGPAPIMLFSQCDARYEVSADGVAIIRLEGVVGRGWSWWWGRMADPAELVKAVRAAEHDPTVREILIVIDSPGGSAVGVAEACAAIRDCSKRTRAHAVGMCASAAYWIACGADELTAGPTATVGCIGVIVEGVDDSEAMAEAGYKVKTLRSSRTPNKAPDVADERWDAEMQAILDELGDVFLTDIAETRGWDVSDLDAVADQIDGGRLMPPKAALEAGLIDQITVHYDVPEDPGTETPTPAAAPSAGPTPEENPMHLRGKKKPGVGAEAGAEETNTTVEETEPTEEVEAGADDGDGDGEDLQEQLDDAQRERDEALERVAELEQELEAKAGADEEPQAMSADLQREVAARHAETALSSGRIVPKEKDGFINALAPFVDEAIRAANGWDALCTAASAAGAVTWQSIFGVRARGERWSADAKTHGGVPEDKKPDAKAATLASRLAELQAEGKSYDEAVDHIRANEPGLLAK